jgi:hypothetical protein
MPSRRRRVVDDSKKPRRNRQTRNTALALVVVAAIMLPVMAIAAGGNVGGGASTTPADCQNWCGNGWATVTINGLTAQISGGGCYDRGADGIDARFGDFELQQSDYLGITGYRPGGATPTPETPGASVFGPPTRAGGSAAGTPFVLGTDATIVFGTDGSGSFSGTDVSNGAGGGFPVKGTFFCG